MYTFTEEDELIFDCSTTPDKDTVINFTQHNYFNLMGEGNGDVLCHELMINSSLFDELNSECICERVPIPVESTPFDFRDAKEIGRDIKLAHEQLKLGQGYDHNYHLDDFDGQLQHVAKGFHVLGFPGRAPPKAGQHISGAQQQQVQTGKSAHSALSHDGRGRLFHKIKNEWKRQVTNKKGRPVARAALWGSPIRELLGDDGGLAEAVAEFLDAAAHVVDRLLCAGVEGVRLAGRVQLVPRQFATVFHFDHFFGVGA
jgi:hypothetical protein